MYGEPEITRTGIKCEECGKWFRKLTSSHTKTHGLTIPEYKEKWGLCNTQPLECEEIKEIRQKNAKEFSYDNLIKWQKENPNQMKQNFFKKGHKTWEEKKVPEQMRKKLENMAVNVQHTQEFKDKVGRATKKMWQLPDYREKVTTSIKNRYNNDPEYKIRISKGVKEAHQRPEVKEALCKAQKKFWNSPKGKKMASERAKKMWQEKRTNK